MLVVSIHSHKGGAGKTTLALLTARHLAERRKRVCVLDLDCVGAGIYPAIQLRQPRRYIEEALLAAAGSKQDPTLEELLALHEFGEGSEPIAFILNAGPRLPIGRAKRFETLHEQVLSLLELERQAGVIETGVTRILLKLQEGGFDYAILDCHPSMVGVSEAVLKVQMARRAEESAFVLVATHDRPHVLGLLKEMHRRCRGKKPSIREERAVIVVNRVPTEKDGRPYRTSLGRFTELADALRREPVVGDEAPALLRALRPLHYCRVLRDPALASAFALGSDGDIPSWPRGIVSHSGTPLCQELFGPS